MPVNPGKIKTVEPHRARIDFVRRDLAKHAKLCQAQALHAEAARLRSVAQRLTDMAEAIEEGQL